MPSPPAEALFAAFSDRLAARLGLYFPPERWPDLERAMSAAAAEFGFPDLASGLQALLETEWNRTHIETLASHLTIGETYFFREPKCFDALTRHILPELIAARAATSRTLRLWSAACCTGEEAYSLAILLDTLIPDKTDWSLRILASDINPGFLRRAIAGIYGEWSFRGVNDAVKATYFTKTPDGTYKIIPRIKKMVTFEYDNLAEAPGRPHAPHFRGIDILFCRNVLMYFRPDITRQVIGYFHEALNEHGWLIPSSVEASPIAFAPFTAHNFGGITLYRNAAAAPAQLPPPMPQAAHLAALPIPAPAPRLHPQAAPAPGPNAASGMLALAPPETRGDDPGALLHLARRHADHGRLIEARQACEALLAQDRLDAASHYLLAIIQQEQGDPQGATASLKRTLFLDPHFALAHFALADLARGQGRLSDASKHYRVAVTLLEDRNAAEILPEADGLTAGRLLELARQGSAAASSARKARNV